MHTFIIPRLKNRTELNLGFLYAARRRIKAPPPPSSNHNQRKKGLPRGEFSVSRALLSNVYLRETWNVSIYPLSFSHLTVDGYPFPGEVKLEYCSSILTWNSNISQVFHQTSCTRLYSLSKLMSSVSINYPPFVVTIKFARSFCWLNIQRIVSNEKNVVSKNRIVSRVESTQSFEFDKFFLNSLLKLSK